MQWKAHAFPGAGLQDRAVEAVVSFPELTPGCVRLYQVNVQVPGRTRLNGVPRGI